MRKLESVVDCEKVFRDSKWLSLKVHELHSEKSKELVFGDEWENRGVESL